MNEIYHRDYIDVSYERKKFGSLTMTHLMGLEVTVRLLAMVDGPKIPDCVFCMQFHD